MTPWHEAYKELAYLLDQFYLKHGVDSGKLFYDLCSSTDRFLSVNWWFIKFQEKLYGDMQSIDPIHVFASLNENRSKHQDKVERINLFMKVLGGSTIYDDINFKGCPSPFSIKIMSVRKTEDQRQIWEVFHEVYSRGRNALSEQMFSLLKKWYGIDVPSFTIFLFWINSEQFLPTDKNTVGFLLAYRKIEGRSFNFNSYLQLLYSTPSELYRDLVLQAYNVMNEGNQDFVMPKSLYNYLNGKIISPRLTQDFKILAFRLLENISEDFKKVLSKNVLYYLYEAFDFSNSATIIYDRQKDLDLFSIDNAGSKLKININAIVGKNGSGKSSVVELLLLCINNLSRKIFGAKSDLKEQTGLEIELYYFAGDLFRIVFQNNKIAWYKYRDNRDGSYSHASEITFDKENLKFFFYTIGINYSLYALNSNEIGDWIDVFYKNNAYQIPVVLNPMRTNGIIDINNEKDRLNQRLFANILGPEPELRIITDKGVRVESIKFSLNSENVSKIRKSLNLSEKDIEFPQQGEIDKIINKVYKFWHIPETNSPNEISVTAQRYIYRKLASISLKYPKYHGYFNPDTSLFDNQKFENYLHRLDNDKSHVTNKLRQAVNYVRFPHLRHMLLDTHIKIETISNAIQTVISENYPLQDLRTIELIPPSFLAPEIRLDDNSLFEALSSGEKQKIYSVSSLVYHLANVNSIEEDEFNIAYRYVNVVYDEAELYFHPDMQRTFINYLLNYLSRVELNSITGLNFCFITHSPLLLSDIPQTNILFLKETGIPVAPNEKIKTFAGNIHELLAESFFLGDSFVGEFARNSINGLISKLGSNDPFTKEEKEHLKIKIEMVGEPFIRNELRRMFYAKFTDLDEKQKLIKELQEQIKSLENVEFKG